MADRCTPVVLAVAIARSDPGNELLKRVRRASRPDDDRAIPDRHVDRVALIDLRLEGDVFRTPQAQAIAHFAIRVMVTMYLH